ncbi:hypothetical protein AAFF_G00007090 [Aldrovandia affinis]|uniref:Uncharacterized protein n=1 Tax=Aldrovandia affinis TaxID=143900 RepID=A0AAD7T7H6_9TELE|nr:hypothetical protein AAFF_G00007090 [Aldrovandia affinis]
MCLFKRDAPGGSASPKVEVDDYPESRGRGGGVMSRGDLRRSQTVPRFRLGRRKLKLNRRVQSRPRRGGSPGTSRGGGDSGTTASRHARRQTRSAGEWDREE